MSKKPTEYTLLSAYADSQQCGTNFRLILRFADTKGQAPGLTESVELPRGTSVKSVANRLRMLADWVDQIKIDKS